jgi:hypothetical protein
MIKYSESQCREQFKYNLNPEGCTHFDENLVEKITISHG